MKSCTGGTVVSESISSHYILRALYNKTRNHQPQHKNSQTHHQKHDKLITHQDKNKTKKKLPAKYMEYEEYILYSVRVKLTFIAWYM
jgi:hypothetical protein